MDRTPRNHTSRSPAEVFEILDRDKVALQHAARAAVDAYNVVLALWDGHSIDALHQRPSWDEVLEARAIADEARQALAALGDARAAALAEAEAR